MHRKGWVGVGYGGEGTNNNDETYFDNGYSQTCESQHKATHALMQNWT